MLGQLAKNLGQWHVKHRDDEGIEIYTEERFKITVQSHGV
jgi:hypothetical protein